MKEFEIEFNGSLTLSEVDIWPDGDGPPDPTIEHVRDRLLRYGDKSTLFEDWCMIDYVGMTVGEVNGIEAVEVYE